MPISLDFQKRYATTVLDLEQLNKDLNKVLHEVQQFCFEVSERTRERGKPSEMPCSVHSVRRCSEGNWWCVSRPCTAGPGSRHAACRSAQWAAETLRGWSPGHGEDVQRSAWRRTARPEPRAHAAHFPSHGSPAADQGETPNHFLTPVPTPLLNSLSLIHLFFADFCSVPQCLAEGGDLNSFEFKSLTDSLNDIKNSIDSSNLR